MVRRIAPAGLALCTLCFAGQAASQTAPAPFTTGFRYDPAGRLLGTISPDPDGSGPLGFGAVRNSYDAAGRLIKVETGELAVWHSQAVLPSAWTGFTVLETLETAYDGLHHKISDKSIVAGATIALTQYSYDAEGRLECTAVRMNPAVFASTLPDACTLGAAGSYGPDRISKNHYDFAGQLIKVQRALLTSVQQDYATYTYSANGKLRTIGDANGNSSLIDYDGFDRKRRWSLPFASAPGQVNLSDYEEYGYDAADNPTSLRRRDGTTITLVYDELNRVTQKHVPVSVTGAAAYSVFYGYDLRGLQLFARFGSASGAGVANDYDNVGRLQSTTTTMDGTARQLAYQYDAGSNRTRIGNDTDYTYDGVNRLDTVSVAGSPIARFSYATNGRRAALTNMAGASAVSSTSYGYQNGTSRLSGITHDLAGTAGDQVLGLSRNPAGQITTRTSSNAAFASNTAYAVNRAYSVNGLNQYTATVTSGQQTAAFQYDANGNLRTDGSSSFVYDGENRLVAARGAKTAQLFYDPLGRLWQVSGAGGTTRFVYDGDRPLSELDGAGAVLRTYVRGSRRDETLAVLETTGGGTSRRSLHTDHQGSVVAISDDAGNLLAANGYDAWGIPNQGNSGRFQFTGQSWIPELGMYHYKARIYSPTLGRFLQTDPIGYSDQMNLYAYVGNDPANMVDPDGLCGYRYDDGTCRVKVKGDTGAEGAEAGKKLEARLNQYDKQINALKNNAQISILNKNGAVTGTITGRELKAVWNNTGFKITNNLPDNGSVSTARGATSGRWESDGDFKKGTAKLSPGAVADWEERGLKAQSTPAAGLDTLIFHELGHNLNRGREETAIHPAHGGAFHDADWTREHRTSSASNAALGTVGGTYVCQASGCD